MAVEVPPFTPLDITDKDIHWAARTLKLPENAFHGKDGTDRRKNVLKNMESLDVAACPGSGKTTLLVAKLAILAEKWRFPTRGICVLSHTNAARHEIENLLGNTTAGRRLLGYPHFIGTIHGFVNEFLALPWLRSKGYPVKIIDSRICEKIRWNKIDHLYRPYLELKWAGESNIRVSDVNFNLKKKDGDFPFGDHTPTYRNVQNACRQTFNEGYHCYDDMFIWANDLIDKNPSVIPTMRNRFPLLFIDEAQDNSQEQSEIIHCIFMQGANPVIRQRFGDDNQAIFNSTFDDGATIDKFPDESMQPKNLPNSHRFGRGIAKLSDPVGCSPCGLIGQGPKHIDDLPERGEGNHTIFLFEENICDVLNAYGQLLVDTFSNEELGKGCFTAVGQTHRNKEAKDDHQPRFVGHYWPEYDPTIAGMTSKPETFVQYVFAGRGKSLNIGESHLAVEKIAEGILRLVGILGSGASRPRRQYKHRYILEMLEGNEDLHEKYKEFALKLAFEMESLSKKAWTENCRSVVLEIAQAICGNTKTSQDANNFLEWKDSPAGCAIGDGTEMHKDNIYPYPKTEKKVAIRVGSIHSVKGETHTATLVFETFWHNHNLDSLKEWFWGDKQGDSRQGVRIQKRLKTHYVAMTRPSHLLCLAMKQSSFEDGQGELDKTLIKKLEGHGWQIQYLN